VHVQRESGEFGAGTSQSVLADLSNLVFFDLALQVRKSRCDLGIDEKFRCLLLSPMRLMNMVDADSLIPMLVFFDTGIVVNLRLQSEF
jgi:hypothetical protein